MAFWWPSCRGEDVTQFAAPAGWRPRPMPLISTGDLKATYELVEMERKGGGSVETYRHRQTGNLVYIGRADVVQAQSRYRELLKGVRSARRAFVQSVRSASTG